MAVLHAGCFMVREQVVSLLVEDGREKQAFRYALCGSGDRLQMRDGAASVGVRGCGHSLCPRCGRRRGAKYVRRVQGWLAYEPHGEIWNICLTQKIIRGESLVDARDRMSTKCRTFMRWLSRRGLIGGTTAHHIVWNQASDGWHYHVHIVAELPDEAVDVEREGEAEFAAAVKGLPKGVGDGPEVKGQGKWVSPDMRREWDRIGAERGEKLAPLFCHRIMVSGAAISELREDSGDTDFWKESTSEVARVVQYPMRDMAQGVSAWRLGGDPGTVKGVCRELLRNAKGWKLRRAWGRWRKTCPAAAAAAKPAGKPDDEGADADAAGKKKAAVGPGPVDLGTVRSVWKRAVAGDGEARAAMKSLEMSVRNKGDFAKRLVRYCRKAWDPGGVAT